MRGIDSIWKYLYPLSLSLAPCQTHVMDRMLGIWPLRSPGPLYYIGNIFISQFSDLDSEDCCLCCLGSSKLTDADNDFRQDNIDNITSLLSPLSLSLIEMFDLFGVATSHLPTSPPGLSSIWGCEGLGYWLGWEAALAFLMRRPPRANQPATCYWAANSFIAHYRGFMFTQQKRDSKDKILRIQFMIRIVRG